jgi:hypothetical protein
MVRLLSAVLAALLVALPAGARTLAPLRLVDLTDDFEAVWDRTQALPDAERATAFKAAFAPILPGFYSEARFKRTPAQYDPRLLRGLKAYPAQRAAIAAVAKRFDGMFQPARRSFEAEFGPMRGYPPIYLVNSLGEFDGGTRELQGRVVLMFGADVIARIHMDHDIQPFFHHELFHLYHHRTFPECEAIWCGLWTEGLATYAAKTLNPKATDPELLLTFPEPLPAAVEKNRKLAVCTVVAALDSKDETTGDAFFSSGRISPELPPRFAYYVGYLTAAEIGKTRSLKTLAQMQPAELRPLIERTLRDMADCPT